MKLNQIIKKLQRAILTKGLAVKIGTSQFYSSDQKRFITMYILSINVYQKNKRGEWKDCNYEIIRTASQFEIVECLRDIWETVKDG